MRSAFIQLHLEQSSMQSTAFGFENNVHQFKADPYGFKTSLVAFIRALEKFWGDCDLNNNLVLYVDNLLIYSSIFTGHLHHIDLVLDKLTSAGFTVNTAECQICKPEINFLGNFISDKGVKANRGRIQAILRCPAPKNQRKLRKFLGTCNCLQQFILNYASYIELLLTLLRKGNK